MKRIVLTTLLFLLFCISEFHAAAPLRFVEVSDHCFYLPSGGESGNVGAVVTDDGVLLIDTMSKKDTYELASALSRLTTKSVRWVVSTHDHENHTSGNDYFMRRGATMISSRDLRGSSSIDPRLDYSELFPPRRREVWRRETLRGRSSTPRFSFGHQMRIYPSDIEVRIFSVSHRAHTRRDLVVFIPSEKVLLVGDLFVPGSFPVIDTRENEGSVEGWFDGMRQIIDAVPLLKPAIPPPKPDPEEPEEEEEEKSMEELVLVIPGHGSVSNLQEMKRLLETAKKLRVETARSVTAGRDRIGFIALPSLAPYRRYKHFDSFAGLLFDAMASK